MLKDRIKEYLRSYGVGFVQSFVPDKTIYLSLKGSKKHIGVLTDRLYFPGESKIDSEVLRLRQQDLSSLSEIMPQTDVVMRISKQLAVDGRKCVVSYGQTRSMVTILRFDVRCLLSRMDDPMREVPIIDTDTQKVNILKVPHVYQVPLIMRYQARRKHQRDVCCLGLMLVLDRNGIKRIDELQPDGRDWMSITELEGVD
jgi:hypothetical protein